MTNGIAKELCERDIMRNHCYQLYHQFLMSCELVTHNCMDI